jgi:two-component system, cell cycle sensor histidine kinase DivJ
MVAITIASVDMDAALRDSRLVALIPLRGRARGRLLVAAVGVIALFEVIELTGAGNRPAAVLSDLVLPLSGILAALACAAGSWARRGRPRVAWALMAAGMALVAVGSAVDSYRNLLENKVAVTSDSGPFYLTGILLAGASLSLLPLLPKGGLRGMVSFLDGMILGSALFLLAWFILLGPLYDAATGSTGERLLPVLYLGGTVALEGLVLFQLSAVKGDVRAAIVLAMAMLALIAANGTYLYMALGGLYVTGSWVDGGWPAGYLLVGVAALLANPREERTAGRWSIVQSSIPFVAIFAAALTAGVNVAMSGGHLSLPVIVLAVAMVAFLCLRLLVSQHDQRRLVTDLADAKERLEEVLDAAPILVFTLDRDGRALLTRGPLASAIDLGGEPIPDRADLPPALRRAVATALDGHSSRVRVEVGDLELEFRLRPADGDGAGPVRVVGVAVDTSEQRRAEGAERENAAKTRFLAQMSHELRTPLNSVLGFTQMLQMEQDPLSDRQRRWLGNVHTSGDHLLALINDVLDLTGGAAGQVPVEIGPVEVGRVVSRAIEQMKPLAAKAGLELTALGPACGALADEHRLEQVLLNLLSNAVKFTPAGGAVTVETAPVGGVVRVTVGDTGIGIKAPDKQRIFDEFIQVSDGRTRTGDGTGLGLALSRRLCSLMGATLEVESEPGRGSRFTVVLQAQAMVASARAAIA